MKPGGQSRTSGNSSSKDRRRTFLLWKWEQDFILPRAFHIIQLASTHIEERSSPLGPLMCVQILSRSTLSVIQYLGTSCADPKPYGFSFQQTRIGLVPVETLEIMQWLRVRTALTTTRLSLNPVKRRNEINYHN